MLLPILALLVLTACAQPTPTLNMKAYDGPSRDALSIETSEDGLNMTVRIGTNPEQPRESGQLELMLLNVSQGQSVYIKFPNGDLMFYDAAPRVKDYASLYEGKTIQYLIISNVDKDHSGGSCAILNEANVKHYIEGTPNFDHPCTTNTCAMTTQCVENEGIAGKTYIEAGEKIPVGSVDVKVLNPGRAFINDNDNSIVLLITYYNTTILLMGDCESKCENKLIAQHYPRDVDILIAGHHGSSTSSSDMFLEMTSPRVALISVGANNQYGHPSQEVLDRFKARNVDVYRTDWQGTIVLNTDGNTIKTCSQNNAWCGTTKGNK